MELSPMAALSEPGAIVIRCAGVVVVIPVVEELAFRGYLLRPFRCWSFGSPAALLEVPRPEFTLSVDLLRAATRFQPS